MSHPQIIKNFADRRINRRTKSVEWGGTSNVFCRDRTLYSYGTHFPLARYMGEVDGQHVFILNDDYYSSSTARHQSFTRSICPGPLVSATALAKVGIEFNHLELKDIPFWRSNYRQFVYFDSETGRYYKDCDYVGSLEDSSLEKVYSNELTMPNNAVYVASGDRNARYSYGSFFILGATVIKKEHNYFLCSLDEGQCFVSQLPRKPKDIEDSFDSLKPKKVLKAERKGFSVKRSGKWFFVSTGFGDQALASLLGRTKTSLRKTPIKPLEKAKRIKEWRPAAHDSTTNYVCRNFKAEGNLYARGKVYHRYAYGDLTGRHKSLSLGNEWHLVFPNTAHVGC